MTRVFPRPRLIALVIAMASAWTTGACLLLTDLSGLTGGAQTNAGDGATQQGEGGNADAIDGARIDAGADGSYVAVVLADDPLAYLRLGELSGAVASDATGHGNAGVLGIGHTFGVPGAIAGDPDTALHLDGARSGIVLGRRFDFVGVQPYSLELWAKIEVVDLTYRHIFKKSARPVAGREAYGLFVQDGLLASERIVAGQQFQIKVLSAPLTGRWVHVVSTYDGALSRLYVDGLEVGSRADTRAAGSIDADTVIGCNDALDNDVVKADLDEVAIYDKALPAERVKVHFDTGKRMP